MTVPRPRTRLVNFRVNDEEYEALRIACAEHRARSISDYARLAVLGLSGRNPVQAIAMQWQLSILGHKIAELEGRMSDLLRWLESRGAEPGPAARSSSAARS